jgi:hypothetical protein
VQPNQDAQPDETLESNCMRPAPLQLQVKLQFQGEGADAVVPPAKPAKPRVNRALLLSSIYMAERPRPQHFALFLISVKHRHVRFASIDTVALRYRESSGVSGRASSSCHK